MSKEIKVKFEDNYVEIDGERYYFKGFITKEKAWVYEKLSKEDIEKLVDEIADKLVNLLEKEMDLREFTRRVLKESLLQERIKDLFEIKERIKAEPKVSVKSGCVALTIGGKRGRPKEFVVVGVSHD